MAFRVLAAALMAYGAASGQAPEFETPAAVVGGTIVTAPGAEPFAGTVVIAGGRIAAVGPEVAPPPGARVFDAAGLWVYAGFIDAATHDGVSEAKPDAAAYARLGDAEKDEKQGPRTAMQWANRKGVWPHAGLDILFAANDAKRSDRRKAGFTAAVHAPRPAILGGTAGLLLTSDLPLRRTTVNAEAYRVASLRAYTEDGPAWGRRAYPTSAMGTAALARQTFLDAEWYAECLRLADAEPTVVARPLRDPVLDAVILMKASGRPVAFAADTADEIHHALDRAAELGLRPVILGGDEAWRAAERLAAESSGVIASLDWPEKPKRTPEEKEDKPGASRVSETWRPEWEEAYFEPLRVRDERIRQWEEAVRNVQRLGEAGVPVAVRSGEGGAAKVLEKLREAAELGLTSEAMVAALTTNAAIIAGADDQVGAIRPGMLANLAILTKPVEDKKAAVRRVYVAGEAYPFDTAPPDDDKDEEEEQEDDDKETESASETEDKQAEEEPVDAYPWDSEIPADRMPALKTGGSVLLENATVLTVTQGTLTNADVLIVDGKIAGVGADLAAPEGVVRIDCSGHFVMPGIVDPHSHMAIRGGVNEFSESVTCEVRIADVVDHRDLELQRALAGGVTAIHAMHGSANVIGGQTAVIKLKYDSSPAEMLVNDGPGLVKFALGENVVQANFSNRGQRFPVTRMGVEAALREAFHDGAVYAQTVGAMRNGLPVRRDLRLESLAAILAGDIWIQAHSYRSDEILRLLAVAEDYGVRVATLHHVLEAYRILPEIARHGASGSTFSDWWAYKVEAADAVPHNAAMMMRAGIVSSINSDDPEVVRHMPLEAAKSIRFGGLTADEALRLITINPARQIGLDGRIGSIEAGKDGDIAVFDGHPLDTFAKTVLTFIEGEVYFQHRDFTPGAAPAKIPYSPEPPRGPLPFAVDAAGRYAIVNATVHPVGGKTFSPGTVIIEDGKIASVGAGPAPEGYTVVDAAGLHVYPGLINAASMVGLIEISGIAATNDATELAYFQPDVRAASAVHPHSEHIPVTRAEGTTAALVVPAGGAVSGQASLIDLTGWTMDEMIRADGVGLVVHLPTLPVMGPEVKADDRKKRIEEHREKVVEIETYFREARHYGEALPALESAGEHVVTDPRLDAIQPYLRGEKPALFAADDLKHILECVRFAETFGLKPVIVGGRDAWKCAPALAEKDVPVIVTSAFAYPGEFDRFDAAYANAARLAEAGVRFAFGAAGRGDASLAKLLPLHAGVSIAHGLDPDRAVRALTLDAAAILGVGDRMGSLEAGKIADVIVTTGHPCRADTRVVASFIAGEPIDLANTVHEADSTRFANRPAPDLPPPPSNLRGPVAMRE